MAAHQQLVIGLSYEKCFGCDKYYLNLSVNYEANKITDLPYYYYFQDEGFSYFKEYSFGQKVSQINMQGLTINARFDF